MPKMFFFFFSSRRRHTRSLRDWSSDVCSSDLRVLDLGALQIGDRVQDTLLVLEAEQKSFDGGAYTVLTFGNATGRLPSAPFFDKDLPYVEGVRRGHVVQVIGEIAEYRGRRQLRVTAP